MIDRRLTRQAALVAAAIGISSAVFLGDLSHLTSSPHLFLFHFPGRVPVIFISVITDVLLLAAACFAAFSFLPDGGMLHRLFWSLILCVYPWLFIKNICSFMRVQSPHVVSLVMFGLCVAGFLLLAFVRTDAMNRAFVQLQAFGLTIFVACGIVGTFALFEAAWFAFKARHLNDRTAFQTVSTPASIPAHRRVLWIILDELGYRELYEGRVPGLHLPAFDRFRGEYTVFSNVQPAGLETQIVLPALMTGRAVDYIKSSPEGGLRIHDSRGWRPFDQHDTVFGDADALGYRSSVVGWFNPYCRILPSVLDSCFWTNRSATEGFLSDRGVGPNVLHAITIFASRLPRFLGLSRKTSSIEDRNEVEEHIQEFIELDRAGDVALSDSRNSFLFLHLPIPHPEGIWDRRTGQFAINRSNYVDNLALADNYLAHVRNLLEASGQWDSTTVVIMGDHPWRTQMWKDSPSWNHDDQVASDGGKFDPRPAYFNQAALPTHT